MKGSLFLVLLVHISHFHYQKHFFMLKKLLFSLILIINFNGFASDGFKYQLKDHQKFEQTISVDLNKKSSLHMLIVKNKNTGKKELIPFYINEQKNIKELSTLLFEDEPELVSFHTNGTTLTLINYDEGNLYIDDIDTSTGELIDRKQNKDVEKPEHVFKQVNKTTFVKVDKRGKHIEFTQVENSRVSTVKKLETPEKLQDKVTDIFKENVDKVNTNEYVKNGSISKTQAYFEDETLMLVYDEKDDEQIETLKIKLNDENPFTHQNYSATALTKLKNSNSYFKDDKLFVVNSGKEDVEMNVFNVDSGKKEKRLSLQKEMAFAEKDLEKRENFIKQSRRSINKPTVTLNETKEGNFAVRMDFVNIKTYSYNDMWWMHHHMIMMNQMHIQQQQQHMRMMMGPNISFLEIDALYTKAKSTSISFVINKNLDLMKNASLETVYKDVDTKKYTEELNKNKEIRNKSLAFLENEYHYIYTDKKENNVYIETKPLNL